MKHLGDITKIDGRTVPTVDVIIGGSPCQDLSIAGKRAGLQGERSGLFMEQIRIVKEMRERSYEAGAAEIRPRYLVWENVFGAFSSNKGEDFRIVLEEIVRIKDEDAVIPRPPKNKWRNSGCIMGNGFSIAWRVFDAQFWGVPQRRRRIALVADLGGESAPEILFVRKSVLGSAEAGRTTRQGVTESSERSIGKAIGFDYRAGRKSGGIGAAEGKCGTLRAESAGLAVCCYDISHRRDVVREYGGTCPTSSAFMGTGGNNVPICTTQQGTVGVLNKVVGALCASDAKQISNQTVAQNKLVISSICYAIGNGQADQTNLHKVAGALNCMHDQQAIINSDKVRRLTPLECERLQGYPDGWTDIGTWVDSKGKTHQSSDSARYKALGNSIAIPPWKWVLKRLCANYERDATMASLFDGIGGFPLIWEQLNGKGSCIWASEIEEFPQAVTSARFNEVVE